MAKKKAVTKSKSYKAKKKRKRGAVAQVVRIHNINGLQPTDGVPVAGNPAPNLITVVGFVKPAGALLDCQLYTQAGALLAQPRQVNATGNRWTVVFTMGDGLQVGQNTQYLFEANLSNTATSAFLTFTLA